jgi:Holliday junction resolvase RusA-like endonuclease
MTNAIRFEIPGVPVAKGRARVTTIGGHARAYTPAKTVAYESTVALMARQAMGASSPMDGPLAVSIVATWPIPASWSKKRRETEFWKTSRPDVDNIAKAIGDGCNGIVWGDDSQIVRMHASKVYGPVPGVVVEVHTT